MKGIGCLVVIALVVGGIWFMSTTKGMSNEDKARIVGQKAHRGWNTVSKLAAEAKEGWKTQEPQSNNANPKETQE